MFTGLFRKCKEESSIASSHMLEQTLEMLEEKENALQKKISVEVKRAKQFTRANNKQAALQCLKRKKFYELRMEQLESHQLRIHDQKEKLPLKLPVHSGPVQPVKSNMKNNCAKNNVLSQLHEV